MSLFLLEGTCLYWDINLNVNANFIALHLEDNRNTNITTQRARPKAQALHLSLFLRNFKQGTSAASSLPPWAAARELTTVSGCTPGRAHSMPGLNCGEESGLLGGGPIVQVFVLAVPVGLAMGGFRFQSIAVGQVVSHIPLCHGRTSHSFSGCWRRCHLAGA